LNGLNIIKKDEELIFPKKEQPEAIIDLFRFFLLIIDEKYESIANNIIIEELFERVMPKYKIDSISNIIFI